MELAYRLRSARVRLVERSATKLMFAMPDAVKNRITLHRMGELTVTKASLHAVEVPAITAEQFMAAMNEPNA